MIRIQTLWLRMKNLFSHKKFAQELNKEIRFHLDQQIAENIAAGMSPGEARLAAIKSFGNDTLVKEDAWESWGWTWLEQIAQDVRFALRQLKKTSGFTTTAVLTLALGIGANAAIFTLVNALLMKSLPVTDPKMLIRIGDNSDCCVNSGVTENGDYALFSTDIYQRLKKNLPEFEDLAAMQAGFGFRPVTVRRDGTQESPRSAMGEFVSGNYFRTFGLRPQSGRLIAAPDDVEGAALITVMSYDAWKRNYAADPSVIGSTFWVNTKAVTLVGIAPAGFYGDRLSATPPDFYLPIEAMPVLASAPYVHKPEFAWLYMIGRLKPGTQLASLQAKISTMVKEAWLETKLSTSEENKKILEKTHVILTPGGAGIQDLQEQYTASLHLLMGVSGLVLLIACANIANLLLVRGIRRKAEMSVRTALGAARGRIVRQLLTESVVLAWFGGLTGLAVAYVGTKMLLKLAFPTLQNMPIQATPSAAVLAFAIGLSVVTGVLFGLAPAWIAARTEPADALRTGARTTIRGASLLQRGLVILQAALSLVLLVGAGLFSLSLNKLENTNLKLDSKNRYIVHIDPQAAGYTQLQLEALYRTIEQGFHGLPGVKNVGLSSYTPMEDNNWSNAVQIQGQPYGDSGASVVRVTSEYFDSVGTRVLMGRGIGIQDSSTAPAVAVVNETFVKDFFPTGTNPIGRRFGAPGPETSGDFEIVGVVEDTVYTAARWKDHRMYFLPMMQRAASVKHPIEEDNSLYAGAISVETQWPMNNMEQEARKTLGEINPNLAVVKFQSFDRQIADRFNDDRMLARLTALFANLALLLAAIGLYGVTAYNVVRRTTEIGIRMALGAQRSTVTAMILRGALAQTAIGLAIGLPVAFLSVRLVQSQLYEVKQIDAAILLTATVALAAASFLAGLVPARRAAGTDPARTLRAD
jgi:macrolide transport system ATP-binding/permease protein